MPTIPQAAQDSVLELPEKAHLEAMEMFKNPGAVDNAVVIVPHRNIHGSQASDPADVDAGIPENSRASVRRVATAGFTFTEVDVNGGLIAHEPLDPRLAGVPGEYPFTAANLTRDQAPGIEQINAIYAARPQDVRLRNPNNFALTDETVLDVPELLQFVKDERLPLNLVFDVKTQEDAQKVVHALDETPHFTGENFIDTAMIKLKLKDYKTPGALDEAFGKQTADRLNVVWVVNANDHPGAFKSQQEIIDSLSEHQKSGRFSIPELNDKDGQALDQVRDHVKRSGGYWIGSYHPTLENDSQLNMSEPIHQANWDTAVDPATLRSIGDQPMLYHGTGECCYRLNDILMGAKFDGRTSLNWQAAQDANVITTDQPQMAREHFANQGRPDIGTLVRRATDPRRFPPLPDDSGHGVSMVQVLAVSVVGVAAIVALAAYRRSRRSPQSRSAAAHQAQPPQPGILNRLTTGLTSAWNSLPSIPGTSRKNADYIPLQSPGTPPQRAGSHRGSFSSPKPSGENRTKTRGRH